MPIDPSRQAEASSLTGSTTVFAISSMLGGEKAPKDAPEPEDDDNVKPSREKPEPDLDQELDDSFPASDPPASTQP